MVVNLSHHHVNLAHPTIYSYHSCVWQRSLFFSLNPKYSGTVKLIPILVQMVKQANLITFSRLLKLLDEKPAV